MDKNEYAIPRFWPKLFAPRIILEHPHMISDQLFYTVKLYINIYSLE